MTLHLIDPGSPGGGACTLRLLADTLARRPRDAAAVVVLGTRAHVDLARRCGVAVDAALAPPVRQPALLRRGLRRLVHGLERERGEAFRVVHAWTMHAAIAATRAVPERRRLATLTVGPVGGGAPRLLARLRTRHPMPLYPASGGVAHECRAVGLDPAPGAVRPPGIDPDRIVASDRAAVRRRWGVDDHTMVVGVLAEPVCWADARLTTSVIIRAALTGRRVRAVVHPAARGRVATERWAAGIGTGHTLITDDRLAEPWQVMAGLDAALMMAGEHHTSDLEQAGAPYPWLTGGGRRLDPALGTTPLLWAMAAGLPVVAETERAVREIVADGWNGLLVARHDLNGAAERLMDLYDDPAARSRIGRAARGDVREHHGLEAWSAGLDEAYGDAGSEAGPPPDPAASSPATRTGTLAPAAP